MVNQKGDNKMKDNVSIGVGQYKIELNEEILKRMLLLSQCDYMSECLENIEGQIVSIWQESEEQYINAKEWMNIISLLHDIRNDYKFVTSLKIIDLEREARV